PEENAVMTEQFDFYKKIIALRNQHTALQVGSFENLLVDDEADVWAFMRADDNERVIVVLNASDQPREVTIEVPDGAPAEWSIELDGGDKITAEDGRFTIEVPAIGGKILSAAK
ncbi:MAG: alpha-glucosidase C-terminal domain-containing protein, partial [Phycisphaerae bacterium]|nr:alpha-glucosidase C-terminal domain-containing protein [Phycisphaerae bacterium]